MGSVLKHNIDKDFTVVSNVLLRSKISAKAKGIFVQIISLPEDWEFSIAGLTTLFSDGNESIKSGIKELVNAGFITWEKTTDKNGRYSVIVTTQYPILPHGKIPHGKKPQGKKGHNKEYKNKELNNKININTSVSKDTGINPENTITDIQPMKQYGNENINNMMQSWEDIVGYKITSRIQKNRNACNNLIKKHGEEKVTALLRGVAEANKDKYGPRIFDFESLQANVNRLVAWGNAKARTNSGKIVFIS